MLPFSLSVRMSSAPPPPAPRTTRSTQTMKMLVAIMLVAQSAGGAKDNDFVVEYCKDCGWECNIAPFIAPFKHKSKNNRNCPQRAVEEGYKSRWEYGSKAPTNYAYVHHPIIPATVR